MAYLGSWKIDDYLTFPANTHKVTGEAFDADSAPTYRIYEDETATPLLTGSLAKLDDANTTGFYSERVQLTAASGFEKGKSYTIYVAAPVDGKDGPTSHTFQIEAEVDANSLDGSAVETAVANQLDVAVPGSPTANSINERVKALDELLEAGGDGDAAAILADTDEVQGRLAPGGTATVRSLGGAIAYDGATAKVALWVEENGVRATGYTLADVELWDGANDQQIADLGDDASPSSDGVFYLSGSASIAANVPCYVKATASKGGTNYAVQTGLVRPS